MSLQTLAQTLGRPIAVLDIETTGNNTVVNEVIEIAVRVHGYNMESKGVHTLIKARHDITPYAYRVHKIGYRMLKGQPSLIQFANQLDWIYRNCILVGFNSQSSDIPIIRKHLASLGHELPANVLSLDLMRVWHRLSGQTKGKLVEVAQAYSVPKQQAHRAMNDVLLTEGLLTNMVDRHGIDAVMSCCAA